MTRRDQISIGGSLAAIVVGALIILAGSPGSEKAGAIAVFALCGLLAYAINWLAFIPANAAQNEHYYDLTGSFTYITLTLVALLVSGASETRAIVVAVLVLTWAVRLGSFLFRRVRKDGGDGRFDDIKVDPKRFFMMWTIQALWVFLTVAAGLAAITTKNPKDFGVIGIIGVAVWVGGFGIEVVADQQKRAFRTDPANDGRYITTGLWAWSRHPNYFGEIMLWTGIAIIAIPVLEGWRWVMLISPIFVYLLITRVSGVPMLEARAKKRWGDEPAYREYKKNTPSLIPRPPRR